MFTPAPTEHELAAAGLTAEDLEGDAVEVWPENQQAYILFADLRTQWRVGMGGPTGLDYLVLYAKLDRMRLTDDEADQLESDLRVMEYEALQTLAESRATG
jgi:hypothetical protein